MKTQHSGTANESNYCGLNKEVVESKITEVPRSPLDDAAFAALGMPVIPIKRGSKAPVEMGWQQKASTTPEQVQVWAKAYPGCSWGAVTGRGIVVVDVDLKNGKDGMHSIVELAGGSANAEDLNTFSVKTPSGQHFYYHVPSERFDNRVEFIPGVDLRGDGGQVLVPPSPGYEIVERGPIKPLPDWIRRALTGPVQRVHDAIELPKLEGDKAGLKVGPRKLVLDSCEAELAKIHPDISHDDWRDCVWAFLSYYGKTEGVVESLEAWSRGYSNGFDHAQFGRLIADFDSERLPVGYDPSKKIRELRGKYPRLEGFLPPEDANGADIAKLASGTTKDAKAFLEKNGNTITQPHEQLLGVVAKTLASVGYADTRARPAISLFTGGGKTVSVASYCAQVSQHRSDLGILIAFGTIEQIREMDDLFVKHFGIPSSAIGATHSEAGGKLDRDLAKEKQFILCTHERIKRGDWDWLYRFGGRQRQIIWDEALISTKTSHINTNVLSDAMAKLSTELRKCQKLHGAQHPTGAMTITYLEDVWTRITSAADEGFVELPVKAFSFPSDVYSADVLELLDGPIPPRVMVDKERHAFWFEVTVPDEFERIVILDASARKRLLEKLDTSIDVLPMPVEKDYSTLTIHYCKTDVGRHTVMDPIKGAKLRKEIIHILQDRVPQGESCVLFHLAERSSKASALKQLQQIHLAGPEGEALAKRIVPVSWGKSKGVNKLKEHRFGTHLGIPYFEESFLRAAVASQKRDEFYQVSKREVREVQLSEHVDLIYQGISRLACRDTQNGVAVKTDFWLFYPDESILRDLKDLFPGLRILTHEPLYVEPRLEFRTIAMSVVEFLADLPSSEGSVSISEVRKKLGISIPTKKPLWAEKVMPAIREEIEAVGWTVGTVKRRSFVRNSDAGEEALSSYGRSDVGLGISSTFLKAL